MSMSYDSTTASTCRYGDCAAPILSGWTILAEESEADYQGHARILAERDDEIMYLDWAYGSCSGCDDWEARDLTREQITEEMRRNTTILSRADFIAHFAKADNSGAQHLMRVAGMLS